ncbi:invasin domain 3-containing protein, partial [Pseudooceanicola sp. MF1-13]|uniref:DUF7507 domain-containing protein n=1 Tax=Pseudooceanicola sp. MF1-13 TaxID=3379095 RepID=UPI003891A187
MAAVILMVTALSAQAQNRVSVGFEDGFIGEYSNQAHAPTQAQTFATLGIDSAVISQISDNGQFGGSQGNDYVVDVTFLYTNGTATTFKAAVNWRDTQGSTAYAIGLIGADASGNPVADPVDGSSYVLSTGFEKSYALQFVGSPRTYQDTGVGVQEPSVSGNAATSGLLDALNNYLASSTPGTKPSPLTATITAADVSIDADGTTTTLVTVQLKDINGNNITTGGFPVTLATSAGTLIGTLIDNGDGTYTQQLQSSNAAEIAVLTGTLDSDGAGSNPAAAITDDASVEFTLTAAPALEGTKTVALTDNDGSNGLSAGDVLTYTIVAENTGNVTLTGVAVTAETMTRADTGAVTSPLTAGDFTTSDATTLAPGGTATFTATYTVTQAEVDAGGLSNSATVSGTPPSGPAVEDVTDNGDDTDGNTTDDATLITPPTAAPALEGTKTVALTDNDGSNGLSAGDVLTYTIVAENIGNVTLTGVAVTAETMTRADTSAVTSPLTAGDFTTSDATTLAPGGTATFTATYTVTQGDVDAGGLSNSATVSGTPPSGPAVEDVTDNGDDT